MFLITLLGISLLFSSVVAENNDNNNNNNNLRFGNDPLDNLRLGDEDIADGDASDLFPYSPAGSLTLSAFTNRWYVMYTSVFLDSNTFCTTVDYDLKAVQDGSFATESSLRVTVSTRRFSANGELVQSIGSGTNSAYGIRAIPGILYGIYGNGLVKRSDNLNPGIFIVQRAGPKDIQTRKYSYAVVSDPTKSFSLVLARDPDDFRDFYRDDVLRWMGANGFDRLWNKPVEIQQDSACVYTSGVLR